MSAQNTPAERHADALSKLENVRSAIRLHEETANTDAEKLSRADALDCSEAADAALRGEPPQKSPASLRDLREKVGRNETVFAALKKREAEAITAEQLAKDEADKAARAVIVRPLAEAQGKAWADFVSAAETLARAGGFRQLRNARWLLNNTTAASMDPTDDALRSAGLAPGDGGYPSDYAALPESAEHLAAIGDEISSRLCAA